MNGLISIHESRRSGDDVHLLHRFATASFISITLEAGSRTRMSGTPKDFRLSVLDARSWKTGMMRALDVLGLMMGS